MFINNTLFLSLAVAVFVIAYGANILLKGGVLNAVVKRFKGETDFKKALLVALAIDLVSFLGLPLGALSNNEIIGLILTAAFSVIVFLLFSHKYFRLSYDKSFWVMIVNGVIITIISLMTIYPVRTFVVSPFYVKGANNEPTLNGGDYLLIDQFSKNFVRGEFVVYRYPKDQKQFFLHRIIGLPGEKVTFTNGFVFINEVKLEEPYYKGQTQGYQDLILGANEYFVLGDNRNTSMDSHYFGSLKKDLIIGKVWARGFPFDKAGFFSK